MYRNRGATPKIDLKNIQSQKHEIGIHNTYIVRYDINFIKYEIISLILILIFALGIYLNVYKFQYEDPIKDLKQTFLTAQLVAIGMTIFFAGIITFIENDRDKVINHIKIVAFLSIAIILLFFGTKLYIDKDYTEEKFGEFYEQYENKENENRSTKENSKNKTKQEKVSIGLSGIKMTSEKEQYIDSSKSAYLNFTTKVMLYLLAHTVIVFILFFLAHRLTKIDAGKDRLEKDDEILFDEEKNFK